MQFDSLLFIQFLFFLYLLHSLVENNKNGRERLLLGASYAFYMAWDYRFISLILFSTLVDYFSAKKIEQGQSQVQKKLWLKVSILSNLGLLVLFKYMDFTLANLNIALDLIGQNQLQVEPPHWLLPVGISFYTFQSMSYTIDVYRGQIKASKSLQQFMLYVSFFPQLVAGPIVKARDFLPQLQKDFQWDQKRFFKGVFYILLGAFKKIVIADCLAFYGVEAAFAPSAEGGLIQNLLATYAYSMQIFCDFSGYSDMAMGCALIFGFKLPFNFNSPYYASNPRDFWRRWHISLSSWIKEYLFIPLGGSRGSSGRTLLNLMVAMLLGGLWHGASWNFIIWGALHGSILVFYTLCLNQKINFKSPLFLKQILFYHFVCFAWIFFRSSDLTQANHFISNFMLWRGLPDTWFMILLFLVLAWFVHLLDIKKQEAFANRFASLNLFWIVFSVFFILLAITTVSEMYQNHQAFIYFRF